MVWEGRNKLKVSIDFRFQRASGPPLAKANKCVNDSDFENDFMLQAAALRSNKPFL